MTRSQLLISAVLAAVVTYPLFMRIVAEIIQPYRLQLAELGRDLLADPRLEPRFQRSVAAMLDDAFDFRVAILIAGAIPAFVVGRLLGLINDEHCEYPAGEVGKKYEKVSQLHTLSIAAANPAAFLVVAAEIIILGALNGAVVAVFSIFKPNSSRLKPLVTRDVLVRVAMRADRQLGHAPV